ncbi:hypothetical protein MMC11_004928 [Xylographa trunciseda]|nr:hypothetical protein [Xylographa trunciseda]
MEEIGSASSDDSFEDAGENELDPEFRTVVQKYDDDGGLLRDFVVEDVETSEKRADVGRGCG